MQRVSMRVALPAAAAGAVAAGVRPVRPGDRATLGGLMHRAYAGTVDDEGETAEDAAAEIDRTWQGAYGRFLPECSRVVERAGALRSAALLTRWQDRPFVAFSFTDPAFAGQGLARACLQQAMQALAQRGERELRLVVTQANAPAVRLYTGLGFRIETG